MAAEETAQASVASKKATEAAFSACAGTGITTCTGASIAARRSRCATAEETAQA